MRAQALAFAFEWNVPKGVLYGVAAVLDAGTSACETRISSSFHFISIFAAAALVIVHL